MNMSDRIRKSSRNTMIIGVIWTVIMVALTVVLVVAVAAVITEVIYNPEVIGEFFGGIANGFKEVSK